MSGHIMEQRQGFIWESTCGEGDGISPEWQVKVRVRVSLGVHLWGRRRQTASHLSGRLRLGLVWESTCGEGDGISPEWQVLLDLSDEAHGGVRLHV